MDSLVDSDLGKRDGKVEGGAKCGLAIEQEHEIGSSAFHPSPPVDEVFDISTTVDPSYIIALIRKLIPSTCSIDCTDSCKGDNSRIGGRMLGTELHTLGQDIQGGNECVEVLAVEQSSEVSQKASSESEKTADAGSSLDEVWEECGCVLWDLSASKTHAELMAEHYIYNVLLANLLASRSPRVTEICLGIIGNLACHDASMERLVSNCSLIEIIIDQLFLDDPQCLCEVFRLLTSALQSSHCSNWIKAIGSETTLSRILWILQNTLNPNVLEKSVGLLLNIIESQADVSYLLTTLMKLGLSDTLVTLFADELRHLTSDRLPERFSAVDNILRSIEAITVLDGYCAEICSSPKLFGLLVDLIKLPDKFEVASTCVTASVLLSNILADAPDFATELSNDVDFLQGLVESLPLASSDSEARQAIWSVMARTLLLVNGNELSAVLLNRYALLFSNKFELIEDDLLTRQNDGRRSSGTPARETALRKMVSIAKVWLASDSAGEDKMRANIGMLLDCCYRYTC